MLEEPSTGSDINDGLNVSQVLSIPQIERQSTEIHALLELLVKVLGIVGHRSHSIVAVENGRCGR